MRIFDTYQTPLDFAQGQCDLVSSKRRVSSIHTNDMFFFQQQKHEKVFMHCSLCGYKSKCPLAMEKHRMDKHLQKFKPERFGNLHPISISGDC